ncbi:MAG: hypothetical protein OEO21_05645 [Candidatus Krumholzibacteria bacterium]|nr:hypothetical protein [Candidatus Krumholzibacteria bacterium]
MGTQRNGARLALIVLALLVGVAAPIHALAAHRGADAADHMHATCGVCFTLAGAEHPPTSAAPAVAADERPTTQPIDEVAGTPGLTSPADPTRGPPSSLA